jgi:hypothetical protein
MSRVPPRTARWGLAVVGALFFAQGLGKAIDPTGYMAALDAFHVLRPATHAPLSLGALALVWTVLELFAGVAMLYGGLSRTPAKQLGLAGLLLALGLSCAYLALAAGAHLRSLSIPNGTCFGSFLGQRLSWSTLLQEASEIATLVWLFTNVLRWPSRALAAPRRRPRSLSVA